MTSVVLIIKIDFWILIVELRFCLIPEGERIFNCPQKPYFRAVLTIRSLVCLCPTRLTPMDCKIVFWILNFNCSWTSFWSDMAIFSHVCIITPVSIFILAATKGDVTLVNLQRQLATPIRNACFLHEFADMLHFWIAFKNFQRVAALQISRKIVRNGPLH